MQPSKGLHGQRDEHGKIPNQKELERELSEYLSKKYGSRVRIISPLVFPKPQQAESEEGDNGGRKAGVPDFGMLPEDLEAYLDNFVVRQDEAKAILATKICTHFNRIKHSARARGKGSAASVGMIKNNVLMIGPTGVGKTYMIKLIAQKLGVPFVKGDATKFSETGYVGGDVEDLVRDLVYEAGDNIELAETGIIYIDEIDKIASTHNFLGHDVSRTGVQRALLKPMEETEVDLKVPHDPVSQIQAIEHYRKTGKKEKKVVNTRNILFIMSGAFGELAKIIRKRLQRQGIGFEADVRSSEIPWDILKQVTAADLVEFGFESEFVGRLPVIVIFDELAEEDLVEILKNPNNPIILSKRLDFRAYGIDIKFEEEALRRIAAQAAAQKTGARGLVSVIEKILIPFEKKLPSTSIDTFLVTPEVVTDPQGELARLLAHPDDPERRRRFEAAAEAEMAALRAYLTDRAGELEKKSGLQMSPRRIGLIAALYLRQVSDTNLAFEDFAAMVAEIRDQEKALSRSLEVRLSFDESAVDELVDQAIQRGESAGQVALQFAKRLEYGLKLIKDRAGVDDFVIDARAVNDPEGYINEFIKRFYRQTYPDPGSMPA